MISEQVLEHRRAGASRMDSLRDLAELLGIAEQHDVASARRERERIGEGYLASLVNEQRVDDTGVENAA
jgi:hypothetical protein